MDRNEFINKVLLKMEEVGTIETGEVTTPDIVKQQIDESTIRFIEIVPIHLLTPTSIGVVTGTAYSDNKTGYVVLPSDFVRLSKFKMSDWKRPVTNAISDEHPLYIDQFNKYTRGGVAKPVVAILQESEGYILQYFSISTSHAIDTALYIKEYLPEELDERLTEPVAWQTAGDVFLIYGEGEKANTCYAKVKQFIDNNTL